MNFVDYCLYTKNFSALSACNEYSKMFNETGKKIAKGAAIAGTAGLVGTAALINPTIARHARKLTGMETSSDRALEQGIQQLRDAGADESIIDKFKKYQQDFEDSHINRTKLEDYGEHKTIRDRWNNLIGKKTYVDDVAEKYGIHNNKEAEESPIRSMMANSELRQHYFKPDHYANSGYNEKVNPSDKTDYDDQMKAYKPWGHWGHHDDTDD